MPVRVVLREPRQSRFPSLRSPRSLRSSDLDYSSHSRQSPSRSRRRSIENLVMRNSPRAFGAEDISASSRLSGYLFIFTAYCVLFVSTVKFRQDNKNKSPDEVESEEAQASEPQLSEWKLGCTLYGSLAFMAVIVFIVAVHFDAFMCMRVWQSLFKDGSPGSGIILLFLLLCSLAMAYVSTSTTGLGGSAGLNYNVFFSAWAGVFACFHTFNLWVESTGAKSIGDSLRESPSMTNFNWACILFFSVIHFLSLLDTFLESGGVGFSLRHSYAIAMLSTPLASALCGLISLVMNVFFTSPSNHWYKVEGLLLLGLSGVWSYGVFRYTGINALVNGPSNSYFGILGCFYYSISTFGVWLERQRMLR